MGYEELPNGFTGFRNLDPDFESAGEASRRAREAAKRAREHAPSEGFEPGASFPRGTVDLTAPAHDAPAGAFQYDRDIHSGRRLEGELPFDFHAAETPRGQRGRFAAAVPDARGAWMPPASNGAGGQVDPLDLRWAWAEIDLSAIRHNLAETRRYVSPRCRIMAVVKADAYGHGAVEVSKTALGAGADCLAVATVPEALQLRDAGIVAPILLLSQPPASSIPLLVQRAITPSVYEPDFAVAYGEAADQAGCKAPFHLAMNTGMNRIGVHHQNVVEFLYQVSFHRALELEGTFTHFATADSPEPLEFERQRRRFEDAVLNIRAAGFNPGIVHAANSAAIYRYPNVHYDMVRQGISLYGFHPAADTRNFVDLRPALSVHARITNVAAVPMSEGVSYGLNYRSPGSVKICTVPLGYADGLRIGLSGRIDFILGGRYYRQVGNICMDQCMFEVDMRRRGTMPVVDPQVGDHVIIVGTEGAAQTTIDEMAEKLHTIHYELAIGFAQRLPRLYR